MAFNEQLALRIREQLANLDNVEEQKMFRGITFMVDRKMCVCVSGQELMCRVDPGIHDELLQKKGCRPVIMRGREYRGYVLVSEDAVQTRDELAYWIGLSLAFNKYAKSSKKRK
jgi:TfoX/Sxy family transcriptional regulator of competence genes